MNKIDIDLFEYKIDKLVYEQELFELVCKQSNVSILVPSTYKDKVLLTDCSKTSNEIYDKYHYTSSFAHSSAKSLPKITIILHYKVVNDCLSYSNTPIKHLIVKYTINVIPNKKGDISLSLHHSNVVDGEGVHFIIEQDDKPMPFFNKNDTCSIVNKNTLRCVCSLNKPIHSREHKEDEDDR